MSAPGPSRRVAILAAVLGLATFAVFVGFTLLPEAQYALKACNADASLITKFQLARTAEDILAVFRAPDDACRAPIVAAMNATSWFDIWVFTPVYGFFLIACIAMLAGSWRRPLAVAGMLAVLVGMGADFLETWTQVQIAKTPDAPEHFLQPLAIGAWTKYAGLAAAAVLMAAIALGGGKPRWIIAVLGLLSAGATAVAFIDPSRAQIMSLSVAVFWVALLVVAIVEAVRGHRPASDAPA